MAGRDTPIEPGGGEGNPEAPPADGTDIFSNMPETILVMEILPKAGEPDNQGKALVSLAGTGTRMRGIVERFLARAPDSYLARLSRKGIHKLEDMFGGSVAGRLEKYTRQFPTRYRGLFEGFRLNTEILNEMFKQADLLKHRYYRDLVRPLVSMTPERMVRAIRGPTVFFTPDVLRLMRLTGVPLTGLLWAAIDDNNPYLARLAVTVLEQRVTEEMLRFAIQSNLNRTRPEIYRLLAENTEGMARDGMLRIAGWHGQPGHDGHIREIHRMIVFYLTVREAEPEQQTGLHVLRQKYDAYVQRYLE
jgi:hypothetical protein